MKNLSKSVGRRFKDVQTSAWNRCQETPSRDGPGEKKNAAGEGKMTKETREGGEREKKKLGKALPRKRGSLKRAGDLQTGWDMNYEKPGQNHGYITRLE